VAKISGTVYVSKSDLDQVLTEDPTATAGKAMARHRDTLEVMDELFRIRSKSLKPAALHGLSTQTVLDAGIARLYYVKPDGTKVDTKMSSPVVNGVYEFANIKEGRRYIVEITKFGYDAQGNRKKIRQKAFANVPASASAARIGAQAQLQITVTVPVTPKTSAIAEFVTNAITKHFKSIVEKHEEEGTLSADDARVLEASLDIIVEAAVNTVNDLIEEGVLQIDSKVSETTANEEQQYQDETVTITYETEVSDETALALLEGDQALAEETNGAVVEIMLIDDTIDEVEARELIRKVLGVAENIKGDASKGGSDAGHNIPDYFIEEFAKAHIAKLTTTIEDYGTAIYNCLMPNVKPSANAATIIDGMVASASVKLAELYALYDAGKSPSGNAMILSKVFPTDARWTMTGGLIAENQVMNVCQGLLVMMTSGIMNGYLPGYPQFGRMDNGGPPFDPIKLMKELNMFTLTDAAIKIISVEIFPENIWISNSNSQTLAMRASVEVYKGPSAPAIKKVVLEYRDTNNVLRTADLDEAVGARKGTIMAKVSDKVREYNRGLQAQNGSTMPWSKYELNPWDDPNPVIDWQAGEMKVKVVLQDDSIADWRGKRIMKWDFPMIQWLSPKGPSINIVMAGGWDEEYEAETIKVDETTGKAKIKASWSVENMPALPEGTELLYGLELYLQLNILDNTKPWSNLPSVGGWDWEENREDGWKNKSKNIWSVWQHNMFITHTQFRIPVELEKTMRDTQNNWELLYGITIYPVLRDFETRQIVWRGPYNCCEFRVGDPIDWTVNLNGKIYFPEGFENHYCPKNASGNIAAGTWKVAFFATGENTQVVSGNVVDYVYKDLISEAASAVSPVSQIVSLGTNTQVKANTLVAGKGYECSYAIPSFKRSDGFFNKKKSYNIVIWYDVTEQVNIDSNQSWPEGYGEPKNDKVDVNENNVLEGMRYFSGGFQYHQSDLWFYDHNEEKNQHININVTNGKVENQQFNYIMHKWWNDQE
jgi:hypothetical protein